MNLKISSKNIISFSIGAMIVIGTGLYKVIGITYDNQLKLLLIIDALIIFALKKHSSVNKTYLSSLILYVAVLNFVEVIYTVVKYYNFSFADWLNNNILSNLCYLIWTPLILYYLCYDRKNMDKMMKMIVFMTAISFILRYIIQQINISTGVTIFEYIAGEGASENWTRNSILRINPPSFFMLFIPCCYYLLRKTKVKLVKALYCALIIMSIWYYYSVTMSRSVFLYEIVVTCVLFLITKRKGKKGIFFSIVLVIVVIIFVNSPLLDTIGNTVSSIFIQTSDYGDTFTPRVYAYEYYRKWMLQNPILGIGGLSNSQLTESLIMGHISDIGFAGNIFRYGILGIVLECFFVGRMIHITWKICVSKRGDNDNKLLAIGLLLSVILINLNIDCFSTMTAISMPFILGIMEYIYRYKMRD